MLLLILACTAAVTGSHKATASESEAATLRELDVYYNGGGFVADASKPGPIIVACEYESGAVTYGPSDDPRIIAIWTPTDDGYYAVGASAEFVDCRLWLLK